MNYSASFTAGGLLFNEFEVVLMADESEPWPQNVNESALQIGTKNARTRVITEIKKRLANVEQDFVSLYRISDLHDRKLLLFYLCLKTYRLVREYHFEVSLKSVRRLEVEIEMYDYELYLAGLVANQPVIAAWSDKTRMKTITNYLRMLREADLANKTVYKKSQPSRILADYFLRHGNEWMLNACFLTEQDKQAYL